MVLLVIFILASLGLLVMVVYCQQSTPTSSPSSAIPETAPLLDLQTTTVAERQRTYKRSYSSQLRYDALQAQAEAANDTSTLEALRLNTYDGPLPMQKPDGTYTHYSTPVHEFPIAGINFRDASEVARCVGVFTARLVAEPTNEFDPSAIKVIHEANIHVGYIPSKDTSIVRSLTSMPALCFGEIQENIDEEDGRTFFYGSIFIETRTALPNVSPQYFN